MTGQDTAFALFSDHIDRPGSAWSAGSFGALAEFLHDAGEPVDLRRGRGRVEAVTGRGGIRLQAWPDLRPIAVETATAGGRSWSQSIAFCLPADACAMAGREALTELGPDPAPLREADGDAILFDLGLALPQADFCLRTADARLIATLCAAAGRPLFDPGSAVMPAILAAAPHRVVLTRFARIEVYQPIPGPGGQSPDGPHTHLLPRLLASGRSHAATLPIPPGWVPAAQLHPAHPLRDQTGRPRPFDPAAHADFQALHARLADPALLAFKQAALSALREGSPPPTPRTRFEKAALRIAQAQRAAACHDHLRRHSPAPLPRRNPA